MLPTALLYAAVSAAELAAELGAPVGLGQKWSWVGRLSLLTIPVDFLAGLLRSRLARSGVGQLVVELGRPGPSGQHRNAPARALHHPTVEVAYWSTEQDRCTMPLCGRSRPSSTPCAQPQG